jgi:hypothetical protein
MIVDEHGSRGGMRHAKRGGDDQAVGFMVSSLVDRVARRVTSDWTCSNDGGPTDG